MLKVLCVQGEEQSFKRRCALLKREITKQVRHMTVHISEKEGPVCEERLGRPRRGAAQRLQEGDSDSDTSACAASAGHVCKGETQQDGLLYHHGNPTPMKSRKTIKYLCALNTSWVEGSGPHGKSMMP
ncbi:hypothetical protein HJG60_009397 [Phyllostomus discolor]|uniref:Uncharacterized protein n=1 Tax=Phyllostomus discolor TaxID=89673 RepID=A0A833YKQ5_9CHIR|nr:hypothetical protein HJG60_009397 [Phyllostomus discolor]